MFVTTLNFCPSVQINGSWIRRGGYISHKRRCSAVSGLVGRRFLEVRAIQNLASSAGYSGDDADLIPVFERRLLVLEEADVFLINIDVHEPAHFTVVIHQPLFDAGIAGLQLDDRLSDR